MALMKNLSKAVIFFLLFGGHFSYAQSSRERNIKNCNESVIQLVGKRLGIENFSYPRDGMYPSVENGGIIIAGTCKDWPLDKAKLIGVFAYDAGIENEKSLIVVFVDKKKKKILASYKGKIEEDAVTEISSYSLWLDTAPYILSKDTRAFGIRANTFRERCAYEGGFDDDLTLFIINGNKIRPVLNLIMHHWSYDSGNRCGGEDVARTDINLLISVEATASNGFSDLRITAMQDGKKSVSEKIRYNGKVYEIEPWNKKFGR